MRGAYRVLACALALSASTPPIARAQADAATAPSRVVFLVPRSLPAPERRALADALEAQFSLGESDLVLAEDDLPAGALGGRIAAARARALDAGAFAICWIDPEPSDRWLVHVLDPTTDRLVVRPVEADQARLTAAIEAVAVMTRDSADAIAAGVALPPPAPAPAPPPAPAPSESPPVERAASEPARPLRLAFGYAGHDFAPETAWRHGALVSAAWMLEDGPFCGLAWMPTGDVEVDAPIRFEVERPLVLTPFAGYRWRFARFAVDAEAGLTLDLWERHTAAQAGTQATSDRSRLVPALSPRVRIEWTVGGAIALYASGGFDVLLSNFEYLYEGPMGPTLLAPHRLRPALSMGFAAYP